MFNIINLLLFSISCKSNENPKKVLYKVSDIEGTWKSADTSETFTISGNGYIDMINSQGITSSTYIYGYDRNQEILEGGEKYAIYGRVTLFSGGTATVTLTFNSASNFTASLLGNTATFTKQ